MDDADVELAAGPAGAATAHEGVQSRADKELVFVTRDVNVYYGDFLAVRDVNLDIAKNEITAFIGPSGCGKSTMLRAFNRMNDLVPKARTEGEVLFAGRNIYDRRVDAVELRRHVGMVFQKPNPFPKSIFDNVTPFKKEAK